MKGIVRLGFMIGFAWLVLSCQNSDEQKEIQFYYYPKTNVYYNVATKNYIYSLDGGKTWVNMSEQINEEPATLGEKVVLASNTDSVWKENDTHRKTYSGKLYKIIDDSENISPVATVVSERKVVEKAIKTKAKGKGRKDEPQEKKRLKKFLNKIFGKRDRT